MNRIFRTEMETRLWVSWLIFGGLYLFIIIYLNLMSIHDFLVATSSLVILFNIIGVVKLIGTIEIKNNRDGGLEYLEYCKKKLDEMSDDEFLETFGDLYDEYVKDSDDND